MLSMSRGLPSAGLTIASDAFAAVALGPNSSFAAPKKPPTIKDLDNQQVDVSPDPPQNVDSAKTMESYKRFLDLNAGDAALRAEALRRLGDLNLESSESERIATSRAASS